MIGFYRELYYLGYLGLLLPIAGKPPSSMATVGSGLNTMIIPKRLPTAVDGTQLDAEGVLSY